MYCRECGGQLPDGSTLCTHCGKTPTAALVPSASSQRGPGQKLRITAIIWIAFFFLVALVSLTLREYSVCVVYLLIGSIGFTPRFLYKTPKREIAKQQISALESTGFIISKSKKYGNRISNATIYIDDVNKKFAVQESIFAGRHRPLRIFLYSDLLDFELNEDGNSIAKGKGVASTVGALTFGIAGAIIGAAGARKSQSTCTSLVVRITVKDLQNPAIFIQFISSEVRKGSISYTLPLAQAKDLMATLHYIESRKT
jgi:hypothetical protein